jgi:hypothetical protein
MLDRPGVYDISLADYLRDPAPVPSLSAGIAGKLLNLSPAHAWHAYNEERQNYRRDGSIGTVFHALFLGKGGDYEVLEVDDFRTAAARAARDEALAAGRTPIKAADFETAAKMAEHAAMQLAEHEVGDFTNSPGKAEQTVLWQEGDVWCRACCDWLPDDLRADPHIYNLKSTACAQPEAWQKLALRNGYDLSAAHYQRGVRQVLGVEVNELFVCIETRPPYCLSVNQLPAGAIAMAERARGYAVERWGECLRRGVWPGYPSNICTLSETPAYIEAAFTERELSGFYDPEMLDQLIGASAP